MSLRAKFQSGIVTRRQTILAIALAMTPIAASAMAADYLPSSLVGRYQGNQTELTTTLELRSDGRFHYALTYGAFDETADGSWTARHGRVFLTSDPLKPPTYTVVSQQAGPSGRLRVYVDSQGPYEQQHFFALITRFDGTHEPVQLGINGLDWIYRNDPPPRSVSMLSYAYRVASPPVLLGPGDGFDIHYSFDPNDLGKVAFNGKPLKITDRGLLLHRYGRLLRFTHEGL